MGKFFITKEFCVNFFPLNSLIWFLPSLISAYYLLISTDECKKRASRDGTNEATVGTEKGRACNLFSNISIHPLSRLHPERLFLESKCQNVKRCDVGGFLPISALKHTYQLRGMGITLCMHTSIHPSSGSHGQLFCPYGGSSALHTHQVYEQANPRIKDLLLPRVVRAKHSFKCYLHHRQVVAVG